MSINLLKRLESSVFSFNLTLSRIRELITKTIDAINRFEKYGVSDLDMSEASDNDFDMDDGNTDYLLCGRENKNQSCGYGLSHMERVSFRPMLIFWNY